MNKQKIARWSLIAFGAVFLLVLINPSKVAYEPAETNYLINVKHEAQVRNDKNLMKMTDSLLLSYGIEVCGVLNTEGKTGDDAVTYFAKKAYNNKNTEKENINIIEVVITNAIRHLCPNHIALLD